MFYVFFPPVYLSACMCVPAVPMPAASSSDWMFDSMWFDIQISNPELWEKKKKKIQNRIFKKRERQINICYSALFINSTKIHFLDLWISHTGGCLILHFFIMLLLFSFLLCVHILLFHHNIIRPCFYPSVIRPLSLLFSRPGRIKHGYGRVWTSDFTSSVCQSKALMC